MKLLLLRVLLQRREREEGYVLPVVVAIGLIMVLLGAVNILSAGEENLNALSDSQKSKALAVAEVGVARYRQFLDRNRMLSVYDSDDWSSVSNTCDINSDIAEAADTTNWEPVNDGGTEPIGEYRIVSYVYDIDGNLSTDNNGQFASNDDNGNTEDLITFNDITYHPTKLPADDPDENINGYNPRGILTIQSRDNANADNVSATQVEVEIPIRINENDMNNLSPALWIGDGNLTSLGNVILDGSRSIETTGARDTTVTATNDNGNGNIVVSKPADGGTPGCDEPEVSGDSNNNRVVYDPRPLPNIIPEPTGSQSSHINELNSPGDIPSDDRSGDFRGENNQLEKMMLLGAKEVCSDPDREHKNWVWWTEDPYDPELCPSDPDYQDPEDSDGFEYFFYKATSDLNIDSGEKVATDGQSRVILYVDEANINLTANLTGDSSLQVGSKFSRGYKSVGLQVYVNGSQEININPGGGTVRIKGLIHAPNSTLNITGNGNVLIEGAVWVNSWNNSGGADVTIIPDNAGVNSDKAYLHYFGTDNRAARPITNAPTDWEIQEVKDN